MNSQALFQTTIVPKCHEIAVQKRLPVVDQSETNLIVLYEGDRILLICVEISENMEDLVLVRADLPVFPALMILVIGQDTRAGEVGMVRPSRRGENGKRQRRSEGKLNRQRFVTRISSELYC